jgi:hypothetical protein
MEKIKHVPNHQPAYVYRIEDIPLINLTGGIAQIAEWDAPASSE